MNIENKKEEKKKTNHVLRFKRLPVSSPSTMPLSKPVKRKKKINYIHQTTFPRTAHALHTFNKVIFIRKIQSVAGTGTQEFHN